MIFLKSSLLTDLQAGGLDGLKHALQQAIQLEHATIPPYLYALYSLGTDPLNATVASIIQSVVSEEMLHMTLACNILNAVGGQPVIDSPTFIPTYPGPLPGGVEGGLTVHIAPFSIDLIKNTFMVIEEPEDYEKFPVKPKLAALQATTKPLTIGQFYMAIIDQIKELGPDIFTGDPSLQVRPPFPEGGIVTDEASAIAAIKLIIDQGEGSDPAKSPLENGPDSALSHFYRFSEIAEGLALIADPSESKGWSYSGSEIKANGPIAPVSADPSADRYPLGTAERHAMDNFNYTYTSLLKGLHQLFNGNPNTFSRTLGAMMSLRQQALDMMAGTNLHGPIGPSFEYQPVNPAGL
jgi:hypothetical protein